MGPLKAFSGGSFALVVLNETLLGKTQQSKTGTMDELRFTWLFPRKRQAVVSHGQSQWTSFGSPLLFPRKRQAVVSHDRSWSGSRHPKCSVTGGAGGIDCSDDWWTDWRPIPRRRPSQVRYDWTLQTIKMSPITFSEGMWIRVSTPQPGEF